MTATEHSKEVIGLMRKLRSEYSHALEADAAPQAVVDPAEPLLGEFVRSFMIWESTTAKAEAVLKRMADAVVDFNELRVCLPDELARMMGERYPRVEERALRLRAALNEIYHRQHAVTLEPLLTMNKRDAKDSSTRSRGCRGSCRPGCCCCAWADTRPRQTAASRDGWWRRTWRTTAARRRRRGRR